MMSRTTTRTRPDFFGHAQYIPGGACRPCSKDHHQPRISFTGFYLIKICTAFKRLWRAAP